MKSRHKDDTFISGTNINSVFENSLYRHDNELVDAFCSGRWVQTRGIKFLVQ